MHTSIVRLLQGVPMNREYADVLIFSSTSAQQAYFESKVKYQFSNLMYIKETEIYIPDQAGKYRDCNYLMYNNPDYPGKWFYGFIVNVEYIADGTTKVVYIEDFLQTWMFEMHVHPCLVVREHVNNDTVGAHIKDEGLALGEYVINRTTEEQFIPYWIVIVSSLALDTLGNFKPAQGSMIGGVYSGLEYRAYAPNHINVIQDILDRLAEEGKSDAIVSMYMLPEQLLPESQLSGGIVPPGFRAHSCNPPQGRTSINGYIPKNNKLYCYPYRGIQVGNNAGQSLILKYEFFSGSPVLYYQGSTYPSGRIIAYPRNYMGKTSNFDYSLTMGDYPQCAWLKDVYSNWLATQNIRYGYQQEDIKKSTAWGGIGQALKAGVGALTGNWEMFGGGIGGAIMEFIGMNQELDQAERNYAMETQIHSMTPPSTSGAIGNDNTLLSMGEYKIVMNEVTITSEYAKSIDDFFSLFGYKVDELKQPNIFGRQSWNYVKTNNAVVTGNCPVYACDNYVALLNRGVRFWHNPDIGNYSLPNGVA